MKRIGLILLIMGGLMTSLVILVVATATTTLPGWNGPDGEPLSFHLEPSSLLISVAVTCAGGYLYTRKS